jgi:hypothetical protein
MINGGELPTVGADDRHVLLDLGRVDKGLLHKE